MYFDILKRNSFIKKMFEYTLFFHNFFLDLAAGANFAVF